MTTTIKLTTCPNKNLFQNIKQDISCRVNRLAANINNKHQINQLSKAYKVNLNKFTKLYKVNYNTLKDYFNIIYTTKELTMNTLFSNGLKYCDNFDMLDAIRIVELTELIFNRKAKNSNGKNN